ncbi:MAG: AmmeMemoRadiSam system protein B [Candidatus Baldrarchaeia archaeon]
MTIRYPAAIGFYPFEPSELKKCIEDCFLSKYGPQEIPQIKNEYLKKVIGGIVPHAGYIYSGPVAAHFYSYLFKDGIFDTAILLGPSHTGFVGASIMMEGEWHTPLGVVKIDEKLANKIISYCDVLLDAPEAHEGEHSIEVQLPFLQYFLQENFKIVPIVIATMDYDTCKEVGVALANAVKETERKVVVIATTDMTHYGTIYGYTPVGTSPLTRILKWIYETDKKVIEKIEKLDAEGLLETVMSEQLTMCGPGAIATLIEFAKEYGNLEVRTLKYLTSYDIRNDDATAIVGYLASALLRK